MGSAAQPLLNLRKRLGNAAQQFSDAHPIDSLETLLGIGQAKPTSAADSNKDPYVMQQQQAALKSFQDAQAARDAARANVRKKYPSLLSGK